MSTSDKLDKLMVWIAITVIFILILSGIEPDVKQLEQRIAELEAQVGIKTNH